MNYSDRYIAILSDTTESGNSPHKVAETIRKWGLINEYELPFDSEIDSWEKYYSPKPMTEHYTNMGKKFLDFFTKIPDTLLTITKSAFTFQKVTMEYIQNLSQSIVAIPLNILEKAQELGYEIKKEISEFAQAYENLQQQRMGSTAKCGCWFSHQCQLARWRSSVLQ
jgi:hypothetical protein